EGIVQFAWHPSVPAAVVPARFKRLGGSVRYVGSATRDAAVPVADELGGGIDDRAVPEVSLAVVAPQEAMLPSRALGYVGRCEMPGRVVSPDFSDRLSALALDGLEIVTPSLGVPQCLARLLVRLAEGVFRRWADRAQTRDGGAPEPKLDHVAAGPLGRD